PASTCAGTRSSRVTRRSAAGSTGRTPRRSGASRPGSWPPPAGRRPSSAACPTSRAARAAGAGTPAGPAAPTGAPRPRPARRQRRAQRLVRDPAGHAGHEDVDGRHRLAGEPGHAGALDARVPRRALRLALQGLGLLAGPRLLLTAGDLPVVGAFVRAGRDKAPD